MKDVVNIPKFRSSKVSYAAIIIFTLTFAIVLFENNYSFTVMLIFSAFFFPLLLYFLFLIRWFHKTRYIIRDGVLLSYPWSKIKVKLSDIKNVERVKRLSFPIGGLVPQLAMEIISVEVPRVGSVPSVATNSDDGVLITTKYGSRYVITPSKPEDFIRHLKS